MSLKIASPVAAQQAIRQLARSQRQIEHSFGALASGSRIVRAGDDAAGAAIAETLRAQHKGVEQAKRNVDAAMGLIQTAEGGLTEQNNILIRMRELAVYSASDTLNDDEREFLEKEFQQLSSEFDRIAKTTRYGSKPLLMGSGEVFEFQVGPHKGEENVVRYKLETDTTGSAMGLRSLSVADKRDARDALEALDEALLKVADARSTFGAMHSRLQYAGDTLSAHSEHLQVARSHIADADIAKEASDLVQAQIRQQAGIAVLAQANQLAHNVIRLID